MISFVLHLSRLKAINIACISASFAEYIRSHRTSQDLHGHLRPYIDPLPLSLPSSPLFSPLLPSSPLFSPLLSSSPLFPISSSTSKVLVAKLEKHVSELRCISMSFHSCVARHKRGLQSTRKSVGVTRETSSSDKKRSDICISDKEKKVKTRKTDWQWQS